mgnify:CR=1
DDEVLRGKITAVGLNAIIYEEDQGISALWSLVSCPKGWSLLNDHKVLYEKISLTGLASTFLHDNNDGSVKRYSVLAYILEDTNKHAIIFDNALLMSKITEIVTSCLASFESRSQEDDDQSMEDY